MQITIVFKGENITLPLARNEIIQGFIYKAASEDPVFSEKLHNVGKDFNGRKYKLFTFSELNGKYSVEDKKIIYPSTASLTVRSFDPYLIQLLLLYCSKNKYVKLGNNLVETKNVKIDEFHIYENQIAVKTLSPITVYNTTEDGHTIYFAPDEPDFYNGIRINAERKYKSHFGNDEAFDLSIRAVENHKYIKRATKFKSTFITAWHGEFILEGSPKILDFLFETGLGSKNSEGFGMLEMKQIKA